MLAAATPHLFDFAKNANALLPGFIDPRPTGSASVNWSNHAPRHGRDHGIYTVFARNLYLQGFLQADYVAGKDLRSAQKPLTHRIDTPYGNFLAFGRYRGLRSTDRINCAVHVLVRTVALARLHELTGEISTEEAEDFYAICVPRVMALMQAERSWEDYLTNALAFCKLQNRSRWRKVARARQACLQVLASHEIFPQGQTNGFSNCDTLDFEPIKIAERQHLLDMADRGDWKEVVATSNSRVDGDDNRLFAYLAVFTPKNIEAVLMADLEADPLEAATKDLMLAQYFIEWA